MAETEESRMSDPGSAPEPSAVAMRLATAYQASRALAVAVGLGLPELLGRGAMTGDEVAQATRTQPAMMRRLLRALAAFDVVEDLGSGAFGLTAVGHCLRADAPASVRPLAAMYGNESLWQTAGALGTCIRTGRNAFELLHGVSGIFEFLEAQPEVARIFDDAMSGRSSITGQAVAAEYDFSGVRLMVDVAGGHGRMLASVLKAHSHMRGILFDLPRVVSGASSTLVEAGVADRCELVGGDMFAAMPSGADLYLLSRVVHDWDDTRAISLLQACRRAMGPEAKLLILDRVMPERIAAGPKAQSDVLLDLTMMLWTGGGRERTPREFEFLLHAANLRLTRLIPMSIPDTLVEAAPV